MKCGSFVRGRARENAQQNDNYWACGVVEARGPDRPFIIMMMICFCCRTMSRASDNKLAVQMNGWACSALYTQPNKST